MKKLLKQAMSAPRGSVAQNEAIEKIADKFEQLEELVSTPTTKKEGEE